MNIAPASQVIEARLDEEDLVIARVSSATLAYMYRYGLAHEHRLRWHRGNLGHLAQEEHDLLEALRLAARLTRVEKNVRRADRRNERLRSEIVRREAGDRPSHERVGLRFPLYSCEGTW